MLPEGINLIEDYAFRSSPESCTDTSFSSDALENISDEDFMTQLSSSLDIPLLLSSGEDEMAVLNSFLDKSPDEILSDVRDSSYYLFNDDMEIKDELSFMNKDLELKNTKQQAQMSPTCHSSFSNASEISYFDYLNRALDVHTVNIEDDIHIKSEMHSEESCSSSNSLEPSTPPPVSYKKSNPSVFFSTDVILKKQGATRSEKPSSVQVVPQVKVPIKRVPIKPKAMIPTKSSNIVLINNIKNEYATKSAMSSNIVVLDSIPVNNFSRVAPKTVNIPKTLSSMPVRSRAEIDPRMLKRQERRIKNRESASISRKKKKDYMNSLEDQVKQLSEENTKLVQENNSLKQRLAFYENGGKLSFNISAKSAKPALVLCAFLLVVGINFNLTRNMFPLKPNKATVETEYPKLSEHFSRNLLWAADDGPEKLNSTYFSPLTMCPASINQTESARLLLELERWIGKPESPPKPATVPAAKLSKQKTKIKRKKLRLDSSLAQFRRHDRFGPENDLKTELEVFSPRLDQLYSEFYQAINRRDDTFYVVSFSEQHMLLPALYHNNTRRPKMSLLMPSMFPNETSTQTYVQLMQIDCEVLDTKLVNVKYATIPRPYRQYGNSTQGTEASKTRSDNATTVKKYGPKRTYKPYVLSKNLLKGGDDN